MFTDPHQQSSFDFGAACLQAFRPCARPPGTPAPSRFDVIYMLRPDAPTAHDIHRHALPLCAAQGMPAHRLQLPSRLHTTVAQVWTFGSDMRGDAMDALRLSGADTARAFGAMKIVFDAVGGSGAEAGAFVLHATNDCRVNVRGLRNLLLRKVTEHGARGLWNEEGGKIKGGETPHMTLVYDAPATQRQEIEPIRWTATHLDLIVSHHGSRYHEVVASWPLNSLQTR